MPIPIHLRGPDHVQRARTVVSCRGTKYIPRLRRFEEFGIAPFGAVPLAGGQAIALAQEFLPDDGGAPGGPHRERRKVRLTGRAGGERLRHQLNFDVAVLKRELPAPIQIAESECKVARAQNMKTRRRAAGYYRVDAVGKYGARTGQDGAQVHLLDVRRPGARSERELRRAAVGNSHLVFVRKMIAVETEDFRVTGRGLNPPMPGSGGAIFDSVAYEDLPRRRIPRRTPGGRRRLRSQTQTRPCRQETESAERETRNYQGLPHYLPVYVIHIGETQTSSPF